MQIDVSGHHLDVTPAISEFVKNKFSKLQNRHPELNSLSVILRVERKEQCVEVISHYQGANISVHASNDDLYAAISSSSKKFSSALAHRKGSLHARQHQKVNDLIN